MSLLQTISYHQPLSAEEEGEWQHRATKLKQELDDLYECKREKEQELDKLREKLQDEKKWEQMEENEEKVMQLRKGIGRGKEKKPTVTGGGQSCSRCCVTCYTICNGSIS